MPRRSSAPGRDARPGDSQRQYNGPIRGDSAGANVAIGAALAIDVADDSAEAEVAGKVTQSGSFTIAANLVGTSQSLASAGSNGGARRPARRSTPSSRTW